MSFVRQGITDRLMHMDPHKTYHCHDHMLTLAGCMLDMDEHMNLAEVDLM